MSSARIPWFLLVLFVPLLEGGCSRRAQAEGADLYGVCQGLAVSSAREGGQAATAFSATRSIDLTFTTRFRKGFSGDHVLELHVFTPDGNLYRKLVTPVTTDSRDPPREIKVPGHRRPLPEQQLRPLGFPRDAPLIANVAFPVAGTDIVSAGLYGTWRVETRLDGGRTACSLSSTFTLTE